MRRAGSNKPRSSSSVATDSERSQPSLNQHKPAKQSRNRIPPPQRERILQKHIAGKSIVDISREENRNRETVARIVHSDEMREHVLHMRESYFGLTEIALSTVRHALEVERDGPLAYKLLTDTGVVPTLPKRMNMLTQTESTSDLAAQFKIMAQLLAGAVVKHRAYGMDISDLEKELADAGGRVDEKGKLVPID